MLLAVTAAVDGVLNDFRYSSQVWRELGQIARNIEQKVDRFVGGVVPG